MRHLIVSLSGLVLVCAVLIGCRGGGGSTGLPVTITSIAPTAAPQGSTATFDATITGGTPPYTYAWTFTDIGTADNPTSATPSVLITGDLGTETVALTVTDSLFATGNASVPFDITDDAVTAVAPSDAGLPLGEATFSASVTGTPDSLAWDFGEGAEPSTITDPAPEVTLQNPGTYSGTVTATFGGVIAPAFPFDYTVAEPVRPDWTIMRVGDASTQQGWINLIEHEERLTAIYSLDGQLVCSQANVLDPTIDADWDTHVIGPGAIVAHHNVVSINGRLAIVYLAEVKSSGSPLRFAISKTSVPTSSADWTTYALGAEFFAVPAFGLTLANVDDTHLMMAFAAISDLSGMRIAVSAVPDPDDASDWENTYLLDKEDTGGFFWPSFAVRDEDIFLTVQEGTGPIFGSICRALRTESRTPESGAEWELLDRIPNSEFGRADGAHDMQIREGKPWVIYAAAAPHQASGLRFFFSSAETPSAPTDWQGVLPFNLLQSPIYPVGISEAENRPAVAVPNNNDQTLRVVRCALVDHTKVSSWIETTVLNYGTTGGGICSAISYNDRIAVAVLTDLGAKVAIAQGPF